MASLVTAPKSLPAPPAFARSVTWTPSSFLAFSSACAFSRAACAALAFSLSLKALIASVVASLEDSLVDILLVDEAMLAAYGQERRLVHQVFQIRARETGRTLGDVQQIHVLGQMLVTGVDLQNRLAALDIRQAHIDHLFDRRLYVRIVLRVRLALHAHIFEDLRIESDRRGQFAHRLLFLP